MAMVPTSTGWPRRWYFFDFLDHRVELLALGAVDHVGVLVPDQGAIGGDDDDFQVVDLLEFRRFRFRRAGHAGQFLVHAEIILEGDRGQGLVLTFDLDAFLGLDGLVQAVTPAPAGHQAAGEFVHDDDLAVFHHVIAVQLEERVRFQRLLEVVVVLDVGGVIKVLESPAASRPWRCRNRWAWPGGVSHRPRNPLSPPGAE